MRVALIPLKVIPRAPQTNLRRLRERLKEVATHRPDLVCLPECALTGYLYSEEDFARFAEPIPGETTRQIGDLIRPYRFHLCFGLLERTPEGVYDAAVLMDGDGRILHIHRKNNEKPPFLNGREVRAVDTPLGRLGVLICGDLFSAEVVEQVERTLSLLVVPLARSQRSRSGGWDCRRSWSTPWRRGRRNRPLAGRWSSGPRENCWPNPPTGATRRWSTTWTAAGGSPERRVVVV